MTWRTRAALALVLVSALAFYFRVRKEQLDAEAAARAARISALEARADSLDRRRVVLERRGDSLAAVYRADTARLRASLAKWRELARVAAVPDTARDTVVVISEVPVLVASAQEAIDACTTALTTCEARVAVERARGDTALAERDTYKAIVDTLSHPPRAPLWWRATKKIAEWLTVARLARAFP